MEKIQLFDAGLLTEKGFVFERVETKLVEEVIPFLRTKYGFKKTIKYVIRTATRIDDVKQKRKTSK